MQDDANGVADDKVCEGGSIAQCRTLCLRDLHGHDNGSRVILPLHDDKIRTMHSIGLPPVSDTHADGDTYFTQRTNDVK